MGYKINYTGDGGGKTVAALGLALRAWGHGKRIVVIQFMKGRKDIGEFMASKKFIGFPIYQFGREGFVDLKNPDEKDKQLAKKALQFARDVLKERLDMLVLDEVNLAAHVGLIKAQDVVDIIKSAPEETIIVLTGRYPPQELIDVCDIVTKIEDLKTIPKEKRKGPKAGFEY